MTQLERAARVHQDLVPPYSPLEKAALVLMREDYPEEVDEAGELTEAGQVYWHRRGVGYVETIRAVLTAIREPGAEVINKGGVGFCSRWVDPWDEMTDEEREMLGLPAEPSDRMEPACGAVSPIVSRTWTAMIDAILAGGE